MTIVTTDDNSYDSLVSISGFLSPTSFTTSFSLMIMSQWWGLMYQTWLVAIGIAALLDHGWFTMQPQTGHWDGRVDLQRECLLVKLITRTQQHFS